MKTEVQSQMLLIICIQYAVVSGWFHIIVSINKNGSIHESFSVGSSERKYLHAMTSLGPVDIITSNASFTHTKITVTASLQGHDL